MLRKLSDYVRKCPGGPLIVDNVMTVVRRRRDARALREWSAHDQQLLEFYGKFVKSDDVVFDVGANVGNRTKVFQRIGATVIAFEPQPYCLSVLAQGFAASNNVIVVGKALGAARGTAELFVSNSNTISSLSAGWIAAVKTSGRFSASNWNGRATIEVTTMDDAIVQFGMPSFVKIDVEGFEPEVLKGVSTALPALSFEFTPECRAGTIECMNRLEALASYRYNFSAGESLTMHWPEWVDATEAVRRLDSIDASDWGDLYAVKEVPVGA